MKKLVQDRDSFAHHIVEITLTTSSSGQDSAQNRESSKITPERNHLAFELSEYKAKVRKLNSQL